MPAGTNTDFGQTLHVWGAREGAYVELPLLGPSTTRDTYGIFVDLFTNPLTYVIEPKSPDNSGDHRRRRGGGSVAAQQVL